ncbi:MAG: precorrin-6B C5,15-methyltransferase / cobalt-precorrin-6B C5,C15-methyltransferase [Solirubrobacteraceae bacterium]|nr:precorrin-6B C5,15-methyltransferase / cobalt-precorrin-6B C5,C15-methyltransferase [Solirubrobacteraceae bacterium]
MITVVGIGADGWSGLAADAREAVLGANLLVGGERQLDLVPGDARGERRAWPKNLVTLVDELPALALDGREIAVLASGDPLLHGVGATILRRLGGEHVRIIPAVSSFALACARLRWPVADVELVSATSRNPEVVAPALQPGRRVMVLGFGPSTAAEVARVARERGFGPSRLVVLEELGGAAERIEESTADDWGDRTGAALQLVALEVRGDGALLGRAPGLPDDAYEHDGQITKRDVRAVTLAALVPVPGQLLWDVGAGSGSVAIEWLRAAPGARAIAIERDDARAQRLQRNALALGVPALQVVHGSAPEALDDLPERPDAIFVGGGVSSYGLLMRCMGALAPGGRLVANVVTVEGETILARAHAEHGGRLTRLSIAHAEPLGGFTGWRPAMPITQWQLRVR